MSVFEVSKIVQQLGGIRHQWRESQRRTVESGIRTFPSREAMSQVVDQLKGALFPMRLGPLDLHQENEDFYVGHTLGVALQGLLVQVQLELRYSSRHAQVADTISDHQAIEAARAFADSLPAIRVLLDSDVLAAYQGDPAARSVDEVLLCYPGVLAMVHHRIAHQLYQLGLPLLARIVAELAHGQTGIDIHPGAQIGSSFFIDHGTGVVIGETAVIGDRVRLYQAVTLGAKRFPTDANGMLQKGLPRHPVLQDDVVIYAGATILGRVTLGRGCTIGGNVWITHDVPAGGNITQAASFDADCASGAPLPIRS